jgi:F0F1-type ATP synthase assembly protein I
MSNRYKNHYTESSHSSMRFLFYNPWNAQRRVEQEMLQKMKNDSEKLRDKDNQPVREAEDRYLALGVTIGWIVGGIVIGVLGFLLHWSVITIFLAVIGGVVLGGLLGALIVNIVEKIHRINKNKQESKVNNQSQTHANIPKV